MTGRPRLLFLSQCLPYPPHSGVTNRTYHIVTQLQKAFDVTLLAFSRTNHQSDDAARAAARERLAHELTEVLTPVQIPSENGHLPRALAHLRSLAAFQPYTGGEYWVPAFGSQLRAWLAVHRPAIVHMDSLDLYRWLPLLKGLPTACTHHSIESDLLRLRATRWKSVLSKGYLRLEAALLERVERKYCPTFATNVMMSELDGSRLRRIAPSASICVAANGVDTDYFRPQPDRTPVPGRVAFLGPTYMFPNKDGIEFFLHECWASVRQAVPGASLHLIGRVPPSDKARFESRPGVTCLGHVPDIRPHLQEAQCSIVPLRVGGGTRLKILDSWALGVAVISTAIGCEGLEVRDGANILIRSTGPSMAKGVIEVLSSSELRGRLETGGRASATQLYSWDRIGAGLRGTYLDIVSGRNGSGRASDLGSL